jgi:hypothetical protein
MVLLPGCGCCAATCAETYASLRLYSAIEVTVSAQDYLRTQQGKYTGCPVVNNYDDFCGQAKDSLFGTTQLFPGSEYAGTFSLSRITPGVWRYNYPATGQRCSNSSLFAQMYVESGFYVFDFSFVYNSQSHCVMDAETYIEKSGFTCTTQNYACTGTSPNRYFTQNINRGVHQRGIQYLKTCSDGSFGIPDVTDSVDASVFNPCQVADPGCGPSMVFTTLSETGSLGVTFAITFIP